ncbi:hypothetical protein BU16DRAFT_562845 [Lophium mytilinum]|uniref:Uncharacterized protein n=1 Tax=Lophium mytilinum TaxID=390894 RepID=A0A6A6QN01_9PEZI|nr:hypothetical protein BU16DRAFT_562845 [Lophium mytilinum]
MGFRYQKDKLSHQSASERTTTNTSCPLVLDIFLRTLTHILPKPLKHLRNGQALSSTLKHLKTKPQTLQAHSNTQALTTLTTLTKPPKPPNPTTKMETAYDVILCTGISKMMSTLIAVESIEAGYANNEALFLASLTRDNFAARMGVSAKYFDIIDLMFDSLAGGPVPGFDDLDELTILRLFAQILQNNDNFWAEMYEYVYDVSVEEMLVMMEQEPESFSAEEDEEEVYDDDEDDDLIRRIQEETRYLRESSPSEQRPQVVPISRIQEEIRSRIQEGIRYLRESSPSEQRPQVVPEATEWREPYTWEPLGLGLTATPVNPVRDLGGW